MASKRIDNVPVVWRKTPETLITNTLFGTVGVRSKYCPGCYKTRSMCSFYTRSPDITKQKRYNVLDPVERLCVQCRDNQKKMRLRKEKETGATLDRFF
jgi:hypothetical protein